MVWDVAARLRIIYSGGNRLVRKIKVDVMGHDSRAPFHQVLSTHHPWVSLAEYAPVRYAVQISTSGLRVSLIVKGVSSRAVIKVSMFK